MRTGLIVLAALTVSIAVALWIAARVQRQSTERLRAALGRPAPPALHVDGDPFQELPAPVARYLRLALRDARPPIVLARLRQAGELRTDPRSDRWMPFEATHTVTPGAPGFVWDARVRLLPFVHLRVRDAYVAGQGSGRVSLLSAIPVASQGAREEVSSGSLHRYLAEAVWYPTSLLPGPALRWTPLTDTTAMATLTDAGITVSLEFRINDRGEVAAIYTPGRWGAFEGGYRQVPWEGHFRGYRERAGMLVPAEGDVGWHVDGQWRCVWKGRVEGTYELVP